MVDAFLIGPDHNMLLELKDIEKSYDDAAVLRAVCLALTDGEILALLGPSGCGKTTLLRIIAGLERPDKGSIVLDGVNIARMPVYRREFGFVFQDYALFPHMNVFENVAFGLRMLGWQYVPIERRVHQVLDLVGMADYGTRSIHELSGGERQRIALARSLAPAPRLLLLDEPLGALDRTMREYLMLELRTILKRAGGIMGRPEGITAIYVTHDQSEALAIADRVAVMNDGEIVQVEHPARLYREPATAFVARFLGMKNLLQGEILSETPLVVKTELGELVVTEGARREPRTAGERVTLLVRPEAAQLVARSAASLTGRVETVSFRGRYQIVSIMTTEPGQHLTLDFEFDSSVTVPDVGREVYFELDSRAIVLLRGA